MSTICHRSTFWLPAALWLLAIGGAPVTGGEYSGPMISLQLDGQRIEGTALNWSKQQVNLLARDGKFYSFDPDAAQSPRPTEARFRGYSASELRQQLARDMGQDFEVSAMGHYLVVHPRGQRDYWAPHFEELYRNFVHYFKVRGFRLHEPQYPLVAIVWKTEADFRRYAQADGAGISSDIVGYYSPTTNRVTLFDAGGGEANADDWQRNSELIIHEAVHQTAYNTGVHRRFAATPRWLVEGLAMMFEAPGVWNARQHPRPSERINRGRLEDYRQLKAAGKLSDVGDLIGSDRLFDTDPRGAYAVAWAFSFYLSEQQPQLYAKYLQKTAARQSFTEYPSQERMADFAATFGGDFSQLRTHFERFIDTLR